MKDGFYWVVVSSDCDTPEVAELSNDIWYLTGTTKTYHISHHHVRIFNPRAIMPEELKPHPALVALQDC